MKALYKKFTTSFAGNQPRSTKEDTPNNQAEKWYLDTVLHTRGKLVAALTKMLGSAEAEEVAQEAYLKLFLQFKQSRPDNPAAYVYRLARNLAIDRLRNQEVVNRLEQLDTQVRTERASYRDPSQNLTNDQDKALILEAINSLPPICRHVFVLRKLHGKSHKEISEDLGISTKTVENHIHKGMLHCHKHVMRSHLALRTQTGKKLA